MIILRERLFGRSDNKGFKHRSETALRDLIKIFTMGTESINANNHWIEVFASNALGAVQGKDTTLSLPAIFSGFHNNLENPNGTMYKIFGNDLKLTPEEYVRKIYNDTLHQRLNGEEKYINAMKNKNPSDSDIRDMLVKFRFIALCLSGQKKPGDWNWNEESLRTPINFSSTFSDRLSPADLRELLGEILREIVPGISL